MRRVVTLPPTVHADRALRFAADARARGAALLEVRTDLHDLKDGDALPLAALAEVLPLIAAERGRALPAGWAAHAAIVDRDRDARGPRTLVSHHAPAPLSPDEAEVLWAATDVGDAAVKHVEPLGPPRDGDRLFETRARLVARFGARVTVLPIGPLALPWRARLAAGNALDYLAADAGWAAAAGQRLLADAVRADRLADRPRLGLLGHDIAEARSPRIHPAPFDRVELPADVALAPLLAALLPAYRGLAVTSPFKRAAAVAVGASLPAVNTLVPRGDRWTGLNTDVEGARALLATLAAVEICVLGDGGVADALRLAAAPASRLSIVRRAEAGARVRSPAVWTWPVGVAPPDGLAFAGQPVAVVAYGRAGRAIADEIARRGGVPLSFGPRWLVAQARAQRRAWGLR